MASTTITCTFGCARGDRLEHEGHEPARRRADAAEAHGAGDLVAQRGHVGVERVELGLDVPGPADHGLALLGEGAAGPVDEGDASSRSRRATWVETFDCTVCSARAAAEKLPAFGDGDEHGELSEVHRWR